VLGAKVIARAKINLFLEVVDRREDGYHELRSVMQSIDLSDELYFRRTDGSDGPVVLRCSERELPGGEENIVWRTIEEFWAHTGTGGEGGVEAFINKKIPVGAGLAGGSADAAAALLALDHIYELDMTTEDLVEIGARVGSDVPFCLVGGTAMVRGTGEIVERLAPLPQAHAVLASPGVEVSTAGIYERYDGLGPEALPPEEEAGRFLEGMLDAVANGDLDSVGANLFNHLEAAAADPLWVSETKKAAAEAGARGSLMTGSGPTVFALTQGLEEAAEVAWDLEQQAPVIIVTSFCPRGAEVMK